MPLIANSQPHTWTMTQLHFPRFVETGASPTWCVAIMAAPSGWATPDGAHRANVARQVCAHLDYGALYY